MGEKIFIELVEGEKIRKILNSLYELTGIAAAVVDMNQKVLVKVGWHELCEKYHRAHPVAEQRCRASAKLLADQVQAGEYVGHRCLNGLFDYAYPIAVEGEQIATLLFGQVFPEAPDEEFFRQQAKQFGYDETAYLEALRDIPIIDTAKIGQSVKIFAEFATMLADLGVKQKEQRETLDFLNQMTEAIPNPLFYKTNEGKYLGCNQAFEEFAGASKEAIIGHSAAEFFAPDNARLYDITDSAILLKPGVQYYEYQIERSGECRYVATNKAPIFSSSGEVTGMVGVISDFTDQKRNEEEIVAAQEKIFRQNKYMLSLHEISLGLLNRHDVNALLAEIVERASELVGTTNGFIYLLDQEAGFFECKIGSGVFKTLTADRVKVGKGLVSKVYATGKPQKLDNYSTWEHRLGHSALACVRSIIEVPLTLENQVIGTLGVCFSDSTAIAGDEEVDILNRFAELASLALYNAQLYTSAKQELKERKRTEKALKVANSDLENKVEHRTQQLASVNQELTAMNEELTAMNEELTAMNEELLNTNSELQNEVGRRQRTEEDLTQAIDDLRGMQNRVIQSEKMAALGSLVAGIAHEINTPVGVGVTAASYLNQVTGQFKEFCKQGKPLRHDMIEYLENLQEASDIIQRNLERAGKLIQSFKQVAVDQSSESMRVFNIKKYLDEILMSMKPTIKKYKHRITVDCEEHLSINGYPGAFAQVITNLVMNTLVHAYEPDVKGNIRISVRQTAGVIELVYANDGKSMDSSVIAKIFDPFFTTKRGTGGTGLGLYIVYNIITQQFGGTIECVSDSTRGVKFHICLPAEEGEAC